ncbi:hypothetical protein Hanom_Chr01g00057181 [Helianthus anomalus]
MAEVEDRRQVIMVAVRALETVVWVELVLVRDSSFSLDSGQAHVLIQLDFSSGSRQLRFRFVKRVDSVQLGLTRLTH